MSEMSSEVYTPCDIISLKIEPPDENEDMNVSVKDISNDERKDSLEKYNLNGFQPNEGCSNYIDISKSEGKSYVCNVCNRSFASLKTAKMHFRTHTGEKPYLCDMCKKSFRDKGNLTYHIRAVHLKEKSYHCDTCGKSFGYFKTLSNHKLTHTDLRPYVCTICSKGFKQTGHLTDHYKTHGTFSCNVCDAIFNTKRNLESHKTVHTTLPIECGVCNKRFKNMHELKRHSKSH